MEPNKTRPSGTTPPPVGNATQDSQRAKPATPPKPDVVDDVHGLATKVAGQAKDLVADQVSGQRERSAGDLGKVANALRQTSDSLTDTVAGPYVEKAAALLDRVSGSVRTANLRDVVRSTEKFARRDPLLFIGGALVVGLLAGRFLKSSAHHDDNDDDNTPGGQRLLAAGEPNGGH